MPPASIARPITPSSASISRTRWPRPSPPIAGIAGHGADGRELVRHQQRARAHPGAGRGGLAPGMAAADHDDVVVRHGAYVRRPPAVRQGDGRIHPAARCVYGRGQAARRGRADGGDGRGRLRRCRPPGADRLPAASRRAPAPALHRPAGRPGLRAGRCHQPVRHHARPLCRARCCRTSSSELRGFDITADILLWVFLPILLFDTATKLDGRELLDDVGPILILAVVAVLMTTAAAGLAVWCGIVGRRSPPACWWPRSSPPPTRAP